MSAPASSPAAAPLWQSGFLAKASAAILIKLGAAGLSFGMFVVLARAMQPGQYGLFGAAFSAATLLALIGSFGQRSLVLRFASVYIGQGDAPRAVGVIRFGYRRVVTGTGAIALVLCLAALVLPGQRGMLLATAALTLTLALAEFQPHPQRAAGRVLLALLPRDILLRGAMISLAALTLVGAFPKVTAVHTCLVMSALLLILTLGQSVGEKFTHPRIVLTQRRKTDDAHRWRRASWGLWGNSVMNAAGRNAAMVMMGLMLPATQSGAFFAALRTAMVLELALMAINIVAAPLLARGLYGGLPADTQALCRKISLMIGLPTICGFAMLLIGGDKVLALFGPEFAQAHGALAIIATGYLFSALAGPTAQIMEMGGQDRHYFRMLSVTTGLSLAALIPLTLLFGMTGGALAIAGNLIALNGWAYIHIFRTTGLQAGLIPIGSTRRP